MTATDVYYLILLYLSLNFIRYSDNHFDFETNWCFLNVFFCLKIYNVGGTQPSFKSVWIWDNLAKFNSHDVGWVTRWCRNLSVSPSLRGYNILWVEAIGTKGNLLSIQFKNRNYFNIVIVILTSDSLPYRWYCFTDPVNQWNDDKETPGLTWPNCNHYWTT